MTKEKPCFKCGETKPLSAFYKHPRMADGHVNKCKECNKRDVRENREARIDYYLEYDRMRGYLPKRVEARKEYRKTEPGKESMRRGSKKWIQHNQVKHAAHTILRNALRSGNVITPKICSECGSKGRIHGHHDDYAFPLVVRWLCQQCHSKWHKENGQGANG